MTPCKAGSELPSSAIVSSPPFCCKVKKISCDLFEGKDIVGVIPFYGSRSCPSLYCLIVVCVIHDWTWEVFEKSPSRLCSLLWSCHNGNNRVCRRETDNSKPFFWMHCLGKKVSYNAKLFPLKSNVEVFFKSKMPSTSLIYIESTSRV